MTTTVLDLRAAPPQERAAAARRAAQTLREGGLVVVPTETVYGIAALASSDAPLAALRALTGLPDAAPLAWHAADPDAVAAVVPLRSALHRRALERLAPGPVTFLVELRPDELERARAALGVRPGAIDDASSILLRIPAHETLRDALRAVADPVVIAGAAPRGSAPPVDARLAFDADALARLALVLNDGPTRLQRPSSLVKLSLDGTLAVLREGAVDERRIRARLFRSILFVCSGNTSRSPMAAAIANDIIEKRRAQTGADPTDAPLVAESAGTGAMRGAPQTPEGIRALETIGVAPGPHQSQPLTRELIEDAERVYVMTPQHRRAAVELAPWDADKIELLDAEGAAIPDPIGHPFEVYVETARRLRELIERRAAEWDEPAATPAKSTGDHE